MSFTLESTSQIGRRMTVQVLWDDIAKKEKEQFDDLAKKAKIPGFRPGKVPGKVLKQRFGESVRYDAVEAEIRRSFLDVIEKESLQLAGPPHFDAKPAQEGQPFEYVATFEVYPIIELVELDGEVITRPVVEITEADLDHVLHDLQEKEVTWRAVERAAQLQDRVTIDFVGSMEGVEFPGGAATDHPVILGSKSLIPGFEEQLVGSSAGDKVTVNVVFPEKYQATDLAGKPASFAVVVKLVEEKVLPAIDAAFAKQFGIEDGSIEGLRAEMKQGMQRELATVLANQLKKQVFKKVSALNPVEVPHALVHDEVKYLKEQAIERLKRSYNMKQAIDLPDALFEKEAKQRVINGLLFEEVVKKYHLEPDAARVRQIVDARVSAYQYPEEMIKYIYSNENIRQNMEKEALEEQVVEKLLEKAAIEEQPTTYFAVMKHDHEGEHDHDHDEHHMHDDHDHVHSNATQQD